MVKSEPSYTVGGNGNWYSHSGKQYRDSSKKLTTELLYDPGGLILGICPKNRKPKDMYPYVPWSTIYNSEYMELI